MATAATFFIYGLCIMFYFMMALLFRRRSGERRSLLVTVLMTVIGMQSIKDLFFIDESLYADTATWSAMTAVDMVAVPLYAFILIELCRPGYLTRRRMTAHLLPFVILPALLIATRIEIIYYIEVVWTAVYGFGYAVWTLVNIPRYHKQLKENFSYDGNINLKWLRIILLSFFAILGLWIISCSVIDRHIENIYMAGTLFIWMFVCFFIYKHESVIDELKKSPGAEGGGDITPEQGRGISTLRPTMPTLWRCASTSSSMRIAYS